MSFKIQPIELVENDSNDKVGSEAENGKEIKPDNKHKFLQISKSSLKMKKSCSPRTCNLEKFQCRKILSEQRSLINNQFWIEMDVSERLQYVLSHIDYYPDSNEFSFTLKISGKTYKVCKKMFLSTLSLIEKNVTQIVVENYEKEVKDTSSGNKPSSSTTKRNNFERSTTKSSPRVKRRKSDNLVKIEYIEIKTDPKDLEFHENDGENGGIVEEGIKNSILEINKKKRGQFSKVKTEEVKNKNIRCRRKFTRKLEESDTEVDSEENSDESWNEDKQPESLKSSNSENNSENEESPLISKRTSRRNAAVSSLEKLKIEPESDVENTISSSDEDNFSNVEDTDDSDIEETNKSQAEFGEDQENKEYSDGFTVPKKMGPTCTSELCLKLVNRNCKSIKTYLRENIFDDFWNNMSLPERKFYVKQNVEILFENNRPRNITPLVYHLTIEKDRFQVCQKMFHSTLALQHSCVYDWIFENNSYGKCFRNDIKNIFDPLGAPKTLRARKRFENYIEKLQLLEDFLNSLQIMPSKSFPQQKAYKNYLTEDIEGLRALQNLYKNSMKSEGITNPLPVKILKKVFCAKHFTFYKGYKKRNAKFKPIDDSEITPEIEEAMKRDQQERQRDKILSKKPNANIYILDIDTCDKKVSPNWNGDGEESEPNSRLCCFNLTISNVINLHTYNYWFCEIDALDTTPSSFITCLMDYFLNFCTNAKQIIIYCRSGDPRFKNIDMMNSLLDYAINNKITITQKFYIPRKHLYKDETECQSIYRSLFRKLRRFEINLPSDYITATVDCKREPMEAKWFHFNQFRDYSNKSNKHRYLDLWHKPEEIEKIKSIICKQDGMVSIKMDFDDDWTILPTSLKCKTPIKQEDWPQLYYDRRKISAIKYQLLQSLKVKLPRDCHFFYDYLTIEI